MLVIMLRVMVKLKKLSELQKRMTSIHHLCQTMILYLQILGLMMRKKIHMFSIYNTSKNFTASQPTKVEFKFDGVVPNGISGYALV